MAANIHATALVLGEVGLLIAGPSGSGKSTLAMTLLREASPAQLARLVSDDQVLVENRNGRLVCRAPDAIAGLAEVFGYGPVHLDHEPCAVIDIVIRLVEPASLERLPERCREAVAGVTLPRLDVPRRNVLAATHAVGARLMLPFSGELAPN